MSGPPAREPARRSYPPRAGAIPAGRLHLGRYVVRFATGRADLEAVQRLRFEVFNRELGVGLVRSWVDGLDAEPFDARSHHLLVGHDTDGVVGTYRLTTCELAGAGAFYANTEFRLETLPAALLAAAVEVGRACVHRDHRNGRVILLLWRGLARYLRSRGKRWLFGCCSVPTLDGATAWRIWRALEARGHTHPTVHVEPRETVRGATASGGGAMPALPRLFESYLTLGARVCSPPAVDRTFGVTDYLVLLDSHGLTGRQRDMFFERGDWRD